MCRWVAYAGPDIFLEDLIFHQENSIIHQSLSAKHSEWVTNGDGFGVAWYGKRTAPGLFKDILPAWNDSNLRSLASQIQSRLFFAHVRASTGTAVTRTNCHPFTYKNWALMHNGKIGGWSVCRKEIESLIHHDLYHHRQGTTDSEALFLVALSSGLVDDPRRAMEQACREVLRVMQRSGVDEPLRISLAVTDGQEVWAFRFSSDGHSPTLFYGTPQTRGESTDADVIHTIASEPSDSQADHWRAVSESSGVHWTSGKITAFSLQL